jgi:predicted aspartyl protease
MIRFLLIALLMVLPTRQDVSGFPVEKSKSRFSLFPEPSPVWRDPSVRLPFRFSGNLMLVAISVDSIRGEFILDTGAPHLVLNKTYFRNYPRFGEVLASGISVAGNVGNQTRVGLLDFGGLEFADVDADMVPLGHLESTTGTPVYGLIGLNLLARLELSIDFEGGFLEFRPVNRRGDLLLASTPDTADVELSMTGNDRQLFVDGSVAGKMLRFCLDTGAETNLLDNQLSNKVMQTVQLIRRTSITGSTGRVSEALLARVTSMQFGKEVYPGMPAVVLDLAPLKAAFQIGFDGVLGMDFLYRHRKMVINLSQRKVRLWKRVE